MVEVIRSRGEEPENVGGLLSPDEQSELNGYQREGGWRSWPQAKQDRFHFLEAKADKAKEQLYGNPLSAGQVAAVEQGRKEFLGNESRF